MGLLGLEIEHRGLTNAEARRMDAEALDVADNSFDVALSSFVLHLLPHPTPRPASSGVCSVPGDELQRRHRRGRVGSGTS